MAGAVDLSALKQQRPAPNAADGGAAAERAGTEVTEANFENEVLVRSNQVPVVVLLWSPRSDACVELVETLAALAAADGGKWSLAAVNVDATPAVAQVFGIQAVPTVVAVAAGQPVSSFEGMQPAEQLRRWLDSLLSATAGKLAGQTGADEPEQVDPALAQAREQLQAGELDAADGSYRAILDADPAHAEAKAAVQQIAFLQRAAAHPHDAVAVADAAPDDIEAAFAAADMQLLDRDVPAAFDRLVALVRRTAGDDRTAVRSRLIELFELFDPTDPDVIAGRRNLASALY